MSQKLILLEFPSAEMADHFLDWFSNSGQQGFMEDSDCVGVDYSKAFESWGYEPFSGKRRVRFLESEKGEAGEKVPFTER